MNLVVCCWSVLDYVMKRCGRVNLVVCWCRSVVNCMMKRCGRVHQSSNLVGMRRCWGERLMVRWRRRVYQGSSLMRRRRRRRRIVRLGDMSLDGVRTGSDLSRRCSLVRTSSRLCLLYLLRQGRPVTHSVAVSELSVLPLRQRAAVAEL